MWKNPDIPRLDVYLPRSLNPVLQSCTTPDQCDMWSIADVSRSDIILHLGNQTQWYRVLLHHVNLTCTRVEVYQGQMYTPCKLNPVLESCTIPCQFVMWKNADVHRSDVTPLQTPPGQTSCYRALVLHVSMLCGRIQTYPGQVFIPRLIEPSALTDPYYIMSVRHVEVYRCIQVTCTLLTNQA